jgi:hypothetical protein
MRSVKAIKEKFGANAFHAWGIKGGSKILKDKRVMKAYKEGRVRIVK